MVRIALIFASLIAPPNAGPLVVAASRYDNGVATLQFGGGRDAACANALLGQVEFRGGVIDFGSVPYGNYVIQYGFVLYGSVIGKSVRVRQSIAGVSSFAATEPPKGRLGLDALVEDSAARRTGK